MKRIFNSLAAISSLLIILACGGGGSTTNDTINASSSKLMAGEFDDEKNWTAYETYDQLEDSENRLNASLQEFSISTPNKLVGPDHKHDAQLQILANSTKREKIVTYTANGLVAESFQYLVANSDSIAMGSRFHGVSVLKLEDLDSPKGAVYNFRKDFLQGLAEYQDKIYAWYHDGSIVDVATGETIYANAPQGTPTSYGATPKNRLIIDNGIFFIGTSNTDFDGFPEDGLDNGLWKIDVAQSSKTKLVDHPVWCIYKDNTGAIWAGTNNGIYKEEDSEFDLINSAYAEQIFEYDGKIYALIKDFFNKPEESNDFDLYEWNGSDFEYVCEASNVIGENDVDEMYAFVWQDTLYAIAHGHNWILAFDGSSFSIQDNSMGNGILGEACALSADGKLFSVGNVTGLNIWDGSQYVQLNTVNTAEALISNAIRVLYIAENGELWIGPETSGFNILDDHDNFELIELAEEVTTAGFFEKNGTSYVQGAAALYELNDGIPEQYVVFACNGERVYYDANHGKLWAFPNHGIGNGALGMLDIDTKVISGTPGANRPNYWQRDYEWDKLAYHFNDIISIPKEDAVLIAVENGDHRVLRYDYNTDEFTKVEIPIESIRYFDVKKSAVFGVGQGSIVKYEEGEWEVVSTDLASEEPYGFAVKHNYAFIPNYNNMEVVHLVSGKTSVWTFDELPIKGEVTSIKMRTNQQPGVLKKAYSMVIGTTKGLVICDLNLQ
jgi:major membrane immunogen (membrane-anchored lipoprotein)